MRMWIVGVLLAVAVTAAAAYDTVQGDYRSTGMIEASKPGKPNPAVARLRDRFQPETLPWSLDYVIERCAEHLATINECDHYRIRYFSLHDIPRQLMAAAVSALSFTCNSAARTPITYIPRPVPNTDNRIFWIDLAWYNWSIETWENISQEDYLFREPLVTSNTRGLIYLKTQTRSNPVVLASWFIYYTLDNGEFINQKDAANFNDRSFYYQLVYSAVPFERDVAEDDYQNGDKYRATPQRDARGNPVNKANPDKKKVRKKVFGVGPQTAAEFEAAWYVDFGLLKKFPIDKGALVDNGFSGVAWQNRILWRVRTAIGTYWRTFDVFRTAGDQDFVETPFPKVFNAGEHIFQDERGAQFYFLSDGDGKGVDFANPFVVKGDPSNVHNTVLVTSRSCIHCHDPGIRNFRNEHLKLRDIGVDLKARAYSDNHVTPADPGRAERFNQFYLQDQKMERLVRTDQDNYAEFVRDCNGLTTSENVQNIIRLRNWYVGDLSLKQVAREHGVTARDMELALAIGVGTLHQPQGVTKGRLGRLVLDGRGVPRHTWERGLCAESGALLREWRKRGSIGSEHNDRSPKVE